MEKQKLIVLAGPTAVGKTDLSIKLAKEVNGSIISADSMQIYKYMDIGSAKIKKSEMGGVKHYLVDQLDPKDEFNICYFHDMAMKAINEIANEGKIPILVGGTGFYIQSVIYDIDFTEEDEEADKLNIRKELEEQGQSDEGRQRLYERLQAIDPESAEQIHPNNIKRVIRAIEFYELNGYKISEHNRAEKEKESPFDFYYFCLNDKRENLYSRIDARVDQMIEDGLVEEVQKLKDMGISAGDVSMQGLGYKEILAYLNGECSLEEAIYIIKRDTRHFAKRQLTWFRHEPGVIFVNKDQFFYDDHRILEYMLSFLNQN